MDQQFALPLHYWATASISEVSLQFPLTNPGLTLICVSRNEAWRLPCFLEHYRKLGVRRFVFLDNNSEDETQDYLRAQPDVNLFFCADQYNTHARRGWMHNLMERCGYHRWYICVDADELFVYDGMEEHKLDALVDFLNGQKIERARTIMLDMYGDGPKHNYLNLESCRNVQDYCRYYDKSGYEQKVKSETISVWGGVRGRLFKACGIDTSPQLVKYPLFFLSEEDLMVSAHHMYPYRKNFISECIGALLHYKFSGPDFRKIEEAVVKEHYAGGSADYKTYARWFAANPDTSLKSTVSGKYSSSNDLAEEGLISSLDWSGTRKGKVRLHALAYPFAKDKESRRRGKMKMRAWSREKKSKKNFKELVELIRQDKISLF